jgi:putrescine aminotransferase
MMNNKLITLTDCYELDIHQTKDLYSEFISPSQSEILSTFNSGSELIKSAQGMYMYCQSGRKILDFSGGIGVLNIGHNNKRLLDARINFQKNNRMEVHKTVFSPYMAALSHNIAKILPSELNKTFICNSGAEAVEGAIKIAYKYHGGKRKHILYSDISFHGKLIASGSISGSLNSSLFPKMENILQFEYDNLNSILNLIEQKRNESGDCDIFAIIIEPFSNLTMRECSPEFMEELRRVSDANNIILIFDEVYTGWGKTGKLFQFFYYNNVVPDVLCMSKSMGGGKSSISAYTSTDNVHKVAYDNKRDAFLHTSTYNGFGEECITAIEAINILIEEDLIEKSNAAAEALSKGLNDLQSKFPKHVKEVRGKSCIQGIVLDSMSDLIFRVIDKTKIRFLRDNFSILKRIPSAALSDHLFSHHNIFTVIVENNNEVIFKVAPSLIVEKKQVESFLTSMNASFDYGIDRIVVDFLLRYAKRKFKF